MKKQGAFVARRHLCWFSRKDEYKKMEVGEVFKLDPDYILWCYENLKYLRFNPAMVNRIKEYRKQKVKYDYSRKSKRFSGCRRGYQQKGPDIAE